MKISIRSERIEDSSESAIIISMNTISLEELHTNGELSSRSYRLLTHAGYQNLQDIHNLSASDLLDLNLGTMAIEELNQLTEKYEAKESGQKIVFWKLEHVRLVDIHDMTDGHYATVGDMFDALESEYVEFADLCVVYRYLQGNCTPDRLLKTMRRRLIQSAPGWILELEIDWSIVRPRLTRALKRASCETILDLTEIEQQEDNGLDSVERLELKNLIDRALTQARA